jgi:formate dehydrogenase subunit gamma
VLQDSDVLQLPSGTEPDMKPAHAWDADRALSLIESSARLPGALLPILQELQEEFGYIDDAAVPLIASSLNISQAEVHGVISFYHDFRHAPPGRFTLQVCRAESCQAMGCERLVEHLERRLNVPMGETTPDGAFTLKTVYCLGNCALSPAMMLNDEPYGRVSPEVADFLIADARKRL